MMIVEECFNATLFHYQRGMMALLHIYKGKMCYTNKYINLIKSPLREALKFIQYLSITVGN